MNDVAVKILSLNVKNDSLGVCFMGQAGIILKAPSGELVAIDLYLSDCCERYFGFKRLMPKLLLPDELEFDYVIATHSHYDHFDPDSIPRLLAPRKTRFFGALDCADECKRLGIPAEKTSWLEKNYTVNAGSLKITPINCDHGAMAPYAVGLYIECGEKRVYIAGDTAYREDIAAQMAARPIDIMFAPINGAFGNLDEIQAAKFISIVKPALAVPCHYWNFAEHHGDPGKFTDEMKEKYPDRPYRLMAAGEIAVI
jgi:Predicted Zn-dependent hydrolases of the beta-lactamase fold